MWGGKTSTLAVYMLCNLTNKQILLQSIKTGSSSNNFQEYHAYILLIMNK